MIKDLIETIRAHDNVLFTGPCDLGVMRNGGKAGAKHAPQALLAAFQKMVAFHPAKKIGFFQTSQTQTSQIEQFPSLQQREKEELKNTLPSKNILKKVAHLGGGHDHIYPLVAAYLDQYPKEKVLILNIDAHLDTRRDQEVHSGTPFRQLHGEYKDRVHLSQLGIHHFANHPQNFEDMGNMEVLPYNGHQHFKEELTKIFTLHRDRTLVLSLDCDGLDASFMSAVSAPNHRGLSQEDFQEVLETCFSFWKTSDKPAIYGLYEYNPLFDDLTTKGARYLVGTLYNFFERND